MKKQNITAILVFCVCSCTAVISTYLLLPPLFIKKVIIFTIPIKSTSPHLPISGSVTPHSGTGVFTFFGDTHRGRGFTYYEKRNKKYKEMVFSDLLKKDGKYQKFLSGSDEVIANLEVAISSETSCRKRDKPIIINMLPSDVSVFKEIGITAVNTANNHSYDCGTLAYEKAKETFKDKGINHFGDGRGDESEVFTGVYDREKFAFFGFEEIEIQPNWEEKIEKVHKYADQGYIPIVNLHWGTEYSEKHTKSQESLAHRFIDEAGARLIIGHHPHVVADSEIYKGIPIYYSLGNFIFDQPFKSTLKGLGVKCQITQKNSSCEELEFTRDEKTYKVMID